MKKLLTVFKKGGGDHSHHNTSEADSGADGLSMSPTHTRPRQRPSHDFPYSQASSDAEGLSLSPTRTRPRQRPSDDFPCSQASSDAEGLSMSLTRARPRQRPSDDFPYSQASSDAEGLAIAPTHARSCQRPSDDFSYSQTQPAVQFGSSEAVSGKLSSAAQIQFPPQIRPANALQIIHGDLDSARGYGGHQPARKPPPKKRSSLQRLSRTIGRISMPLPARKAGFKLRDTPKMYVVLPCLPLTGFQIWKRLESSSALDRHDTVTLPNAVSLAA